MSIALTANIITLFGAIIMVGVGFIHSKKTALALQCLQFAVMGAGNLLLGGITGFVSNIVGIARNLVCSMWVFSLPVKLLFILVQTGLCLAVNTQGLLGLLPAAAAIIFTWFMDTEDPIVFKFVIMGTSVMWMIYDFAIGNYVAGVFDCFTVCSALAAVVMMNRKKDRKSVV